MAGDRKSIKQRIYFAALVTLLVNDPVTGEQRNTTVAVLGKGSSFGVCSSLHVVKRFSKIGSFSNTRLSWRFRAQYDLYDL